MNAAEPLPRLLLHICCGPCAGQAVERFRADYAVTGFFSNSNLAPPEEYARRLAAARQLSRALSFPLVEDAYDHGAWLESVRGLEAEPERGRRCERCFAFNLGRAARHATAGGFDAFTTTLTTSPHKDSGVILRIGSEWERFLAADLKQGAGFRRSMALARELGLYRQRDCGCEFSRRTLFD
jgi:hypothetical protein